MAKNQIIGGNFQNSSGGALSLGYFTLNLNRDCNVTSSEGQGQIGRGSIVTVSLDISGNVTGVVLVWPNDQLLPSGNYYIVNVYTAEGQLVSGPYPLTITTTPSPFVLP
jgi:hypothetical protein